MRKTKKQRLLEALDNAVEFLSSEHCHEEEKQMLLDDYDDNYYGEGTLLLGNMAGKAEIDIESVWTDVENGLMLHVNHETFEGDIIFASLRVENQARVINMMRRHIEKNMPDELAQAIFTEGADLHSDWFYDYFLDHCDGRWNDHEEMVFFTYGDDRDFYAAKVKLGSNLAAIQQMTGDHYYTATMDALVCQLMAFTNDPDCEVCYKATHIESRNQVEIRMYYK